MSTVTLTNHSVSKERRKDKSSYIAERSLREWFNCGDFARIGDSFGEIRGTVELRLDSNEEDLRNNKKRAFLLIATAGPVRVHRTEDIGGL